MMMTIGIIYYSRTGNTRQAAKLLEEKLKEQNRTVNVIEIEAVKKPGFFKAGYAAFREIVVGSPIWAHKPAPFIKTFFNKAINGKGKNVGLFVTGGGPSGSQTKAIDMMKRYAQSQDFVPVDTFCTLQMKTGKIKDGAQTIDQFMASFLKK
jgi:flavodoxin